MRISSVHPRLAAMAALCAAILMTVPGCAAAGDKPSAPPVAMPESVSESGFVSDAQPDCVERRSFASSDKKPRIAGDKLVAGVDLSDPSMSHWNAAKQQFEGFNIDLLLNVAKAIWPHSEPRTKVTFLAVLPGEAPLKRLEAVGDQHVDVIATSFTATCERAKLAYFSRNYLDSGQTALVRRKVDNEPEYAGMEQLGGQKVCAAASTTSLTAIIKYRTASGQALVPVQARHSIDCLIMLRQKQVEAVSTDENILRGYALIAPDTMLVKEAPHPSRQFCKYNIGNPCTWFSDEPHAFAFSKNDEQLTRFFNYVLEQMGSSGAWQQKHDEWLPDHPDKGFPEPQPPVRRWPW
jgi:polar amino acid transport system substrate-binding protein